jgi:hypothetical protein
MNAHNGPMTETKLMKYHSPDLFLSCHLFTCTAIDGQTILRAKNDPSVTIRSSVESSID